MSPIDRDEEVFRYGKPGTHLVGFRDRLELTTGMLWAKKRHTVLYRFVTGLSVVGVGGSVLLIRTTGATYKVEAGIGAGAKARDSILEAMHRRDG
jgi:hypothetical protein